MPGLVGFMHDNHDNDKILEEMIDSIKYEDFYKVDKYANSSLGIARVHLGTFNPESQPIFNEDGSLCIFFVGKIYNYYEDMEKLENIGYNFKFKNDAEFCLYSFEEYGEKFVEKLNGSFIFAILNLIENKIYIFNDRYGLRPLYYYNKDNCFIFASETKAFLKYPDFKKELDHRTIVDWFAFGQVIGDRTFFEDIKAISNASIIVYDGINLSIKKYWDYKYEPDYNKSEDEFVDELVAAFKKAAKIRMQDDYKYGLALSGGLDSRVVLASIDESKMDDILSFTFGPYNCDEVKIAKKVAKVAKTKIRVADINPEMIIKNAQKEIYYTDGMNSIGVSFILAVYNEIKDDYNVLFDGFALDLLLGGSFLREWMFSDDIKEKYFDLLFNGWTLFSSEELDELFVDKFIKNTRYDPKKYFKERFDNVNEENMANSCDIFALKNRVRRLTAMGNVLLRTIMEHSFLTFDNDLVDIISKIPPNSRFKHKIYRKFLIKLSPELAKIPYDYTMVRPDAPLILWRIGTTYQYKKEQFKVHITKLSKEKISLSNKRSYINYSEWFRNNENWKKYFKDLLSSEKFISKKYINQKYVKNLIDEHEEGKSDNSTKILYIASFELFLRVFMENKKNN